MADLFRGRPVSVQAEQWFPDSLVPGVALCKACAASEWKHGWVGDDGQVTIEPGQWLVRFEGEPPQVVDDRVFRLLFEATN